LAKAKKVLALFDRERKCTQWRVKMCSKFDRKDKYLKLPELIH